LLCDQTGGAEVSGKTRSWWGWENVEEAVAGAEHAELTRRTAEFQPDADLTAHRAPPIEAFGVGDARIKAPRDCGRSLRRISGTGSHTARAGVP
jgi:hypothetical protein